MSIVSEAHDRHVVTNEPSSEYNRVEVVIDDLGDLGPDLKFLLQDKKSRSIFIPVSNSEAHTIGGMSEKIYELLEKIVQLEGIINGGLRIVIRVGGSEESFSDDWHSDLEESYIYSTKLPTELLRDPSAVYASRAKVRTCLGYEPDKNDIWTPPVRSLIKMPRFAVHRRPTEAKSDPDRLMFRVIPTNKISSN